MAALEIVAPPISEMGPADIKSPLFEEAVIGFEEGKPDDFPV